MSLAHEHSGTGARRVPGPPPMNMPLWNPVPFGESEATFRTLMDSIADYAIFMLDVTGKVASWSLVAERMKGYPAAEIIGRHYSCFYTPEDLTRRRPQFLLETATAMGRAEDEGWRLRKDGTRFWANVVITAIRSKHGELRGYAKVVRDFTDRKSAEQLVVRHRQDLQDYIDSMSTFNAKVSVDGSMLLVNKAAQHVSGLTPDQLRRTHFLEGKWFTYDPEVRLRVTRAFYRACAGESINYDERIFALGSVMDINFSLVPVRGPDGKVAYLLAEGRDITPLKTTQAALLQRSRELENANRELESFSYSVSHDLRAPLRSIDGFTQALLDDHAAELRGDAANYLQRVRGAAGRMGQLIDALLKLSQLARGEIRFDVVDLSDLARSVIDDLQHHQPDRQIELVIQPAVTGHGEAQLLRIVLVNLLGNAWKFTRKAAAPRIEFGAVPAAATPEFFVRDNGAGFNPVFASRLFGPFQRLHEQSEYEGTGIGLATVQRIIARHGGSLRAESQPGAGATFYFTLPNRQNS